MDGVVGYMYSRWIDLFLMICLYYVCQFIFPFCKYHACNTSTKPGTERLSTTTINMTEINLRNDTTKCF